jgi:GT2 family glycosyltransferase
MALAQQAPLTADVVIVNWNTGPCLRECLSSLARSDQSLLAVAHVVVIDNASKDHSASGLDIPGLRLTVLRNANNRGFAAACNQGAALCRSEHVIFLNPDTQLFADTLRTVGRFLRTRAADGVGICGARMVDQAGQPRNSGSRFPTLRILLGEMTGLSRLLPGLLPPHHLRPADTAKSGPVDQVIGAFFLVRRPLFVELGGFDERYFLYFEEVDFALRARQRGQASYLLSPARVYHAEHGSSDTLRGERLRHLLCSRSMYTFRHWPRREARLLLALTLSIELAARLTRAVLRGSRSELRDTVVGYRGFLGWLRRSELTGGRPPCT